MAMLRRRIGCCPAVAMQSLRLGPSALWPAAPLRCAARALPGRGSGSRQQRGLFTLRNYTLGDNTWHTPVAVVLMAIGVSSIAFTGYSLMFGPGSMYPKHVRELLREGGMSYMRPAEKQDLPRAVECYTQALAALDELGQGDPKHARNTPHVTGLVARIASVYTDMGDLDKTIATYKDLLQRILGRSTMDDPKPLVTKLLDSDLPSSEREGILRALGCANKLAETYVARGARSKRRSVLIPNAATASSADTAEAARWYQWCLQLVMLTYQNHFNHLQLDRGLPPTDTPSFDPDTLPRYLPLEMVTSLLYNAGSFFAGSGQTQLAVPLLQRALDLMRRGTDGKETSVCRSSTVISHLASAAVDTGDLAAAEKWAIEGLGLAKTFPKSADCLGSFVALTYSLGAVYEAAGKTNDARVQYRQAIEVANAVDDTAAAKLSSAALARVSPKPSRGT
ncbi:hypothetical protein GGF46_000503 [Coemansia sp. RSA 552]|nr:hypothetical protein GGF46_000503 [Coemansia sp. RSA 552]